MPIPSRRSSIRFGIVFVAALAANSCMTEPACGCSPPPQLSGTYVATRLHFTQNGQATVDALAAGASLTITLVETGITGGTTSGSLVIPAAINGGTAETLDLTGTFENSSVGLVFAHAANTFIKTVPWSLGTNTLLTASSSGGVTYDVVLTRN
jgi:hypothetical protein